MDKARIGLTLLLLSLLTWFWYLRCPIVSDGETSRWKRNYSNENGEAMKFRRTSSYILIRSPHHFWPGVAILWPLVIGGSFLFLGGKSGSEKNQLSETQN